MKGLCNRLLTDPIVNYYIDLLKECIEVATDGRIEKGHLKHFYVCLSHDVDNLWSRNKYVLASNFYQTARSIMQLRGGDFARRSRALASKLIKPASNYMHFKRYIQLEGKYGARSTFYFINERGGRFGSRYKLDDLSDTFSELKQIGWGIGMHTNFYSYNSPVAISKEKEALQHIAKVEVIGARNHYLRFQCPDSWSKLEQAGLLYDTSLGYSDAIGFRAGVASPFNPYDLHNDKVFRIVEIPLVIMDSVLFTVLDLSKDKILTALDKLIDKVASVNGCITCLWHSESLDDLDYPGWGELYQEILELVTGKGGIFTTEQELVARWSRLSSHNNPI